MISPRSSHWRSYCGATWEPPTRGPPYDAQLVIPEDRHEGISKFGLEPTTPPTQGPPYDTPLVIPEDWHEGISKFGLEPTSPGEESEDDNFAIAGSYPSSY
jgi:hypothetical protein